MIGFRAQHTLQWQDKQPNTKTHQQGWIFVFSVHQDGKKDIEHENTPNAGGLRARHSGNNEGRATTLVSVKF